MDFNRVLAFVFAVLFVSTTARAQNCPSGDSVPDRYLVRVNPHATALSVSSKASPLVHMLELGENFEWIHHASGTAHTFAQASNVAVADLLVTKLSPIAREQLRHSPDVLSIEPDCWVHLSNTGSTGAPFPNDAKFSNGDWARELMHLPEAWQLANDASTVTVAISDTGVDLTHEDLQANLWTNFAELNGRAGVDDDSNGYVDDIHGYDFADHDSDPSPGTLDGAEHGTHVAGIVGAVGNNGLGVAGVAWNVKLMPLKGFPNWSDRASVSDLLKTIYYATDNGARVINCSWGVQRHPNSAEIDAFHYALSHGTLPVAAAGNNSGDAAYFSPAAIPGILAVGAVNSQNRQSSFTNYGRVVGIYAPGGDSSRMGGNDEYVLSTFPADLGGYGEMRGTSMAAPFVSGLAALIFATNPSFSPQDVIDIIQKSAHTFVPSFSTSDSPHSVLSVDALQALQEAPAHAVTAEAIPDCSSNGTCVDTATSNTDFEDSPSPSEDSSSSFMGCGLVRSSNGPGGPGGVAALICLFTILIAPLGLTVALRQSKQSSIKK